MEIWELVARESIRDLVARYNANGDSGRFEQVLEVFAEDATMELVTQEGGTRRFEGRAGIRSLFTETKDTWGALAQERATPHHVRHVTGTHQIDVGDQERASSRCYFFVLMPHGLDHWGRYLDTFGVRDGRWLIVHRRVVTDGRVDSGFTD
jgi:3-phenylpropionate/cinnamic acid dioxygenase small subunit